MAQALDGVVVEVDVTDLYFLRQRVGIDRVAVVLSGDMHEACLQVLDGVVSAAMTEFELERAAAYCAPDDLIAEADAEDW